jgi:hypothetical protein
MFLNLLTRAFTSGMTTDAESDARSVMSSSSVRDRRGNSQAMQWIPPTPKYRISLPLRRHLVISYTAVVLNRDGKSKQGKVAVPK